MKTRNGFDFDWGSVLLTTLITICLGLFAIALGVMVYATLPWSLLAVLALLITFGLTVAYYYFDD
jgi:uncharacterized protein YybS (DUF2232 family)